MANITNNERAHKTYVLHVNIADSNPKIWRELSVPDFCTLGELHMIIQIAFGWENEHLHSFTVRSTQYGMSSEGFGFDDDDDTIDENDVRLYDLKLRTGLKFRYLYDFGDSWEHEITVSKTIDAGANEKPEPPRCLGGERAGPPEDVGGIWGYERLLTILKDPTHEEYEDMHDWQGDYDAEKFDIEDVNDQLAKSFPS